MHPLLCKNGKLSTGEGGDDSLNRAIDLSIQRLNDFKTLLAGVMSMIKDIKHFLIWDEGVTAIEYALIASIVATAIVLSFPAVSAKVGVLFQTLAAAFP
jgi:Flp pilus assembly pilin Flp